MINIESLTKDQNIVKKLLIGALMTLIGIGLIPLAGWTLEAARRVIQENDETLPEWDNFGELVMKGLKLIGLVLIWTLPMIVIITGFALGIVAISGQFASQDDAAVFIVILNFCVVGLVFLYVIPVALLLPAAIGILADTDSLGAAANPRNSFKYFRANWVGYLVAVLIGYVVSLVLTTLGTLLCGIGIFPATALTYGVMGQLYGIAHRDAKGKMGLPAAI